MMMMMMGGGGGGGGSGVVVGGGRRETGKTKVRNNYFETVVISRNEIVPGKKIYPNTSSLNPRAP